MSRRLLFADDDLSAEPYLVLPFQDEGFIVDVALSGYEAYCLLTGERHYDAVIVDSMMAPGNDPQGEWSDATTDHGLRTGLVLLRKMKTIFRSPPPVWVLTAFPDSEVEEEEASLEFVVRVVRKPCTLYRLAHEIAAALSGKEEWHDRVH